MKLFEVIPVLKDINNAKKFIARELPNVEYYQVDTYLLKELNINAEIRFFDGEAMPDSSIIEIDGIVYVNLFPFSMLQEMVEEYNNLAGQPLTDIDIATKLLTYRINDA